MKHDRAVHMEADDQEEEEDEEERTEDGCGEVSLIMSSCWFHQFYQGVCFVWLPF